MNTFNAGDAVHPTESRGVKLLGSFRCLGVTVSTAEKGGDGEASLFRGLLN